HPLKKLILAIVHRIIIHPDRLRPTLAAIGGGDRKDIDVTVAEIAPGNVQRTFLPIHANLRKAHRARNAGDSARAAEIRRSHLDDGARWHEGFASIARSGER